jgi:hypothetical protein
MPLWHDRRPERPQNAGKDREATRDSKKDVRVDNAADDKKKDR